MVARSNIGALGQRVRIPLPGGEFLDVTHDRTQENIVTESSSWFGTAANGGVILVLKGEDITGSVTKGYDKYSIRPLGGEGGFHMIMKLDQTKFLPD